jgi:hypothetical protein
MQKDAYQEKVEMENGAIISNKVVAPLKTSFIVQTAPMMSYEKNTFTFLSMRMIRRLLSLIVGWLSVPWRGATPHAVRA